MAHPDNGSLFARQGIYICQARDLYLPGNGSLFARQGIYICQAMDLYLPGNISVLARQWTYICQAMNLYLPGDMESQPSAKREPHLGPVHHHQASVYTEQWVDYCEMSILYRFIVYRHFLYSASCTVHYSQLHCNKDLHRVHCCVHSSALCSVLYIPVDSVLKYAQCSVCLLVDALCSIRCTIWQSAVSAVCGMQGT